MTPLFIFAQGGFSFSGGPFFIVPPFFSLAAAPAHF